MARSTFASAMGPYRCTAKRYAHTCTMHPRRTSRSAVRQAESTEHRARGRVRESAMDAPLPRPPPGVYIPVHASARVSVGAGPEKAAALVRGQQARFAVAPDARPVPDLGGRGDAPANADRGGRSGVPAFPAYLPDSKTAGRRRGGGGSGRVVGAWLLLACSCSPSCRSTPGFNRLRLLPADHEGCSQPAGSRRLHGCRCSLHCLPAASCRRGRQRDPGSLPTGLSPAAERSWRTATVRRRGLARCPPAR